MNRFYSKNIENAAVSLDTQCFRIYSNLSKESPLETQSFRVYSRIKEEVYRNAMMNPQASHPEKDIESCKNTDEDNFDNNAPRPEHAWEKESKNVNEQPPLSADNEHEYRNTEYYYQMVEHDLTREKKPHDVDHHHETDDQDSQAERGNDDCYQVTQLDKEPKLHDVGYRYEMDRYDSQSVHQQNDECYQVFEPNPELKLKEPKQPYNEHQEHEKPYQVTEPDKEPKPHDEVDYHYEVDEHDSQLGHQEPEKLYPVTQRDGESERYEQNYPHYHNHIDDKDKIIESPPNEEHHQVIEREREPRNYDQDEHHETLERQEIGEHQRTKEHRDEEPDRHETDYRYNTDDPYKEARDHHDTDKRYEATKPNGYADDGPFSSDKHYEIEESDEPPLDISMMKPGERLRRAREQRKLSVQHVADRLYLDAGIINALEADNYDNLPPAIFIRGYLRNYARLMEIPPESIIESYNLVGQPPTPPPSITPQFKQKKPASSHDFVFKMVTVVIVVTIMFLVTWAWRYYPNINQEFQSPLDISENDADASSLKAFHKAMEVNEIYTQAVDETITNTPEPKVNNPETTVEPAASEPNPPTPEPTEAPATPPTDNSHTLRIHFTDRAWMRVTDNNDKKLYEGIGKEGKILPLKGTPPFHLKVGNVEGVKVEYQGETNDIRVYPKQKGRNYFIIGSDE